MFSNFFKIIWLTCCFFLFANVANAKDIAIEEKSNEFLITKWTTEEGLPQNSVTSIAQTNDGYIWVGTFGGLARFDGVKFTIFNTANSPVLETNRILSLYVDKRNTLWIGTETGEIYTLAKGKFQKLEINNDVTRINAWGFYEGKNGSFLISSTNLLEKLKFNKDGTIQKDSAKVISRKVDSQISEDTNNNLWMVKNSKLYELKDSKLILSNKSNWNLPNDLQKLYFTEEKDNFWVIAKTSAGTHDEQGYKKRFSSFQNYNLRANLYANKTFWIQQTEHLYEFGKTFSKKHSLIGIVKNGSRSIFYDKEGNLWIGTNAEGLIKLRKKRVILLSNINSLSLTNTYSVIEDKKGVTWVGEENLLKIQNGKTEKFIKDSIVKTLALDDDDNLWFGGFGGLSRFKNGKTETFAEFNNKLINVLFFDKSNKLWIGTANDSLWTYNNDKFEQFTTKDGLIDKRVHRITQTKNGTIWLGTVSGISKIKNGKFENITTTDGLSNNFVREIIEDDAGTIWIGTYGGGISRIKNGKIQVITKEEGLHDDFVSRILVDDYGKFWVLGNRGILAVEPKELNDVADGKKKVLIGSLYGVSDGMKTSEANGGHQPAGWKTKDGRLWFPMIEDMVIIDPTKTNKVPPNVVIEKVSSKSQDPKSDSENSTNIFDNQQTLDLQNGLRNLEIQYTGLSFAKPAQIKFFYKLDGLDEDWIDAGTRRAAFYPYLPAGNYTFQVKAITADGISSENSASLKINVAKAFWQTWWFILLTVCAVIALIIYIYQMRLKQLEKRRLRQQEFSEHLLNAHESERQRIASELHDGLGQNLLIIKNWALLGLNSSTEDITTKQFGEISETAKNALDETHSIVSNLRPQNLSLFGLTEALNTMLEQISESTGIVFQKDIENIDNIFSDEAEICIYRIFQECLNNIVKHSESPRASISIKQIENKVKLKIQDVGKGFTQDKYLKTENNRIGFGLTGISQRVKLLGGSLDIKSAIDEGTTISIELEL